MAAKTLYFKNQTLNATFHALQDGGSQPTVGLMATGWTVAKLASPNTSAMLVGTKRASNTFQTGDSIPSFSGGTSCWRSEFPIDGVFANASWTFTFRVRASSSASSQTGQVKIRVYKSSDNLGTADLLNLTSTVQAGTTTAALSTSVSQSSTVTWTPGTTIAYNNEYLWVQCEWSVVGTSGNNNADVLFYIDSSAIITTPNFVQGYRVSGAKGTFSLSGQPVNLTYHQPNTSMPVSVGAFTLSGKPVNLTYGTTLTETTIYSVTSTSDSAGWGGYCMRSVVPVTGMADASHLVVVTDLGASSDLRLTTGQGTISGPGSGAMVAYTGPPVSQYEHAFEGSAKIDGYSAFVNEIQIRGAGATREVRVRLEGPSATTVNITTASIGIWNGTNDPNSPYMGSTTFTPVQLKWSGVANISLSSGAQSYSDWVVLPNNITAVYGAYSMASINSGWQNYTLVTAHLTANLRAAAGSQVRIGLYFHTTTAAGQTAIAYINQAAASGDAYDFKAGTPARLMFGGSDTLTFDGVKGYILSDWFTLPDAWDNTKNYNVSIQFPPGGTVDIHYGTGPALGGSLWYRAGVAEAALVDKTSYAQFFANVPSLVEIIEVRAAAGPAAYTMPVTAGTFTLAGTNTYLIYGTPAKVLTAATGAVTLAGTSTGLRYGAKLPVTAGAFTLTGQTAALRAARAMPVTQGTFTLAGTTTGLRAGRRVPVTVGAVSLNGRTAGLRADRRMPLTVGAFALSGKNVDLISSASGAKYLVVATGAFALSGKTTNLKAGRKGTVTTGAFTLTGNAVDLALRHNYRMPVTAGAFALTRNPAVLRRGYTLRAGWGVAPTVFDPAHTSPAVTISGLITTNTLAPPPGEAHSQTALSFPSGGTKIYAELLAINQEALGNPGFGAALQSISVTTDYPGSNTSGIAAYGANIWYNSAMIVDPEVDPPVEQGQWGAVAVDRIAGTVQWRNITANNAWTTPVAFPISIVNAVCFAISHYEAGNKFGANFDSTFLGQPPSADYTRWNGEPIVRPVTLKGYPVNLTVGLGHDIVLHVQTGTVLLSGFAVDLRAHQLFLEKQPGELNFGYQNVYLNRW